MRQQKSARIALRSLLVVLALAGGMALSVSVKEARATPPCGTCVGGRFAPEALSCSGAYADCENCTVCGPPRI